MKDSIRWRFFVCALFFETYCDEILVVAFCCFVVVFLWGKFRKIETIYFISNVSEIRNEQFFFLKKKDQK